MTIHNGVQYTTTWFGGLLKFKTYVMANSCIIAESSRMFLLIIQELQFKFLMSFNDVIDDN